MKDTRVLKYRYCWSVDGGVKWHAAFPMKKETAIVLYQDMIEAYPTQRHDVRAFTEK